jgi:hypothetical protein
VSCPGNDTNVSNTSGDADGENENGADDVTGYCSATDESGSENSDGDCVYDAALAQVRDEWRYQQTWYVLQRKAPLLRSRSGVWKCSFHFV